MIRKLIEGRLTEGRSSHDRNAKPKTLKHPGCLKVLGGGGLGCDWDAGVLILLGDADQLLIPGGERFLQTCSGLAMLEFRVEGLG